MIIAIPNIFIYRNKVDPVTMTNRRSDLDDSPVAIVIMCIVVYVSCVLDGVALPPLSPSAYRQRRGRGIFETCGKRQVPGPQCVRVALENDTRLY